MHILCGGGDVKLNLITTLEAQRRILLTAGEGNVVEKIDLMELAREGAPPLQFLQPAYLCSSNRVKFRSVPCDASTMCWSRAFYAYQTYSLGDYSKPAILCLSGRTDVWRERLEPGESRDFALGNVIAVTVNIVANLRPSNQYHAADFKGSHARERKFDADETSSLSRPPTRKTGIKKRLREFKASVRTLFKSTRAREGFFVCELTNCSDKPAYAYVQLNKGRFYGGSGLVGVVVKFAAIFFRSSHFGA